MRNNIKQLCIVCALGLLSQSCGEDNTSVPNEACQTPGFVRCDGKCIDPTTSSDYCGANEYCEGYEVCKENQTCQVWKCVDNSAPHKSCNPPGYVLCDDTCIDPMTSKPYCGANEYCEGYESCTKDQTCQNGVCTDTSEQPKNCNTPGYVLCDDTCIDPMISKQYCGANSACEGYESCAKDQTCQNGVCTDTSEQPKNCNTPGQVMCDDTCIDPMTSKQYCGANSDCKE